MKLNRFYLCLSVLFICGYLCYAQTAEDYFFSAGKKYTDGNTEAAITDLEQGLKLNPIDTQAKDFLALCLNEIALKYYIKGDYQTAMPYLEKLIKLFPDPEVTKMYEHAKKVIETIPKGLPGVPPKQELPRPPVIPVEKTVTKAKLQIEKQKEQLAAQKIKKGEEGKITELRKEMLNEVLSKAEQQLTRLSSDLQQTEERIISNLAKQQKELKRTYFVYSLGVVVALAGFIFLIVSISSYISHRRLKAFQEKLYLQKGMAYGSEGEPVLTYDSAEVKEIIDEIDTRAKKLAAIESINAELVSEKDLALGEKLLQPFIEDEDVIVKIKAYQSMWKYNAAKTIENIKMMLNSPDISVVKNGLEILQGIESPQVAELLLEVKTESEEIKKEIIKVISGILETKKDFLSASLSQKIEQFIADTKKNWVVS
ncbi:MAG: hypothetical protein AB1349_04945 [Elusimicrobiota bacterium]